MVPEAGLEPARSYEQRILSPLRLPIPSFGQVPRFFIETAAYLYTGFFKELPRVKRNSSTVRVSDVGVDQGDSHPAQNAVFTHAGDHILHYEGGAH